MLESKFYLKYCINKIYISSRGGQHGQRPLPFHTRQGAGIEISSSQRPKYAGNDDQLEHFGKVGMQHFWIYIYSTIVHNKQDI